MKKIFISFLFLCYLIFPLDLVAKEIRLVVSYKALDVHTKEQDTHTKKLSAKTDRPLTDALKCLKTSDNVRTICVPNPHIIQGARNQKDQHLLSKSQHDIADSDFYPFTVDADSFKQVKDTLDATGWYATIEEDILVSNGLPVSPLPTNNDVLVSEQSEDETLTNDPWLFTQYYHDDPNNEGRESTGAHDFWPLLTRGALANQERVGVAIIDSEFHNIGEEVPFVGGASFTTVADQLRSDNFFISEEKASCGAHGLGVASVVGATPDNRIGYVGSAGKVDLYAARVMDCGTGFLSDTADALMWFAGKSYAEDGIADFQGNVKVANLSLGGETNQGCPSFLQNAIDYATERGITVVAAAGNDGFPAANHTPSNCQNVITVGANGRDGSMAGFSNYGPEVDISAGGVQVAAMGSDPTQEIAYSGTSFSTPMISSALVHAMRINPNLKHDEAELALKLSSRPHVDTSCETLGCGAGILDVPNLVEFVAALGAEKANRISWALNDETKCDQQWYVDNFGNNAPLCSMFKLTFLNNIDTNGLKYRLYAHDESAQDQAPQLILETTESSVLLSKDEMDISLFNYEVVLCTDEECTSEAIRFQLNEDEALATSIPSVCEQ